MQQVSLSIQTWIPTKKKKKTKNQENPSLPQLPPSYRLISNSFIKHSQWKLPWISIQRPISLSTTSHTLFSFILISLSFNSSHFHTLKIALVYRGTCPPLPSFQLFPIPAGSIGNQKDEQMAKDWLHSVGLFPKSNTDLLKVTLTPFSQMISVSQFAQICDFTKLLYTTILGERVATGLNGSEWCLWTCPLIHTPPSTPPLYTSTGSPYLGIDAAEYSINQHQLNAASIWIRQNMGKITPPPLGTTLDRLASSGLFGTNQSLFYSQPFINDNSEFIDPDGNVYSEERMVEEGLYPVPDVVQSSGFVLGSSPVDLPPPAIPPTENHDEVTAALRKALLLQQSKKDVSHQTSHITTSLPPISENSDKEVEEIISKLVDEVVHYSTTLPSRQTLFTKPFNQEEDDTPSHLHPTEQLESRYKQSIWLVVDRLTFNRMFVVNSISLPPKSIKTQDELYGYIHPPITSLAAKTLINYSKRRWTTTEAILHQPILSCCKLNTSLDYLHTIGLDDVDDTPQKTYFLLPQFCGMHPWEFSTFMESKWFPSIIYLLENEFLARDFGAKWLGGLFSKAVGIDKWEILEGRIESPDVASLLPKVKVEEGYYWDEDVDMTVENDIPVVENDTPVVENDTPVEMVTPVDESITPVDETEQTSNQNIPILIQQPPIPLPEIPNFNIDVLEQLSSLCTESLTAPGASLGYSYETLETIGDTMLKLISSIFLFCTRPAWNDGLMSRARQVMIQNCTLSKFGKIMGSSAYMNASTFSRRSWIPPRWCLGDGIPDDQLEYKIPQGPHSHGISKFAQSWIKSSRIGDKVLADSVESFVGAVGMCLGLNHVMLLLPPMAKLVHERGELFSLINAFPRKDYEILVELVEAWGNFSYPTVMGPWKFLDSDPLEVLVPYVPLGEFEWMLVKSLQQSLGYTFTRPEILVTALVHSSFKGYLESGGIGSLARDWISPCPINYERLEFLGDAILDHVMIQYWVNTHPTLPPQQLTHLRSASVNNHFLVMVAVELGLHRWLRIGDLATKFEVDDIVKQLEEDGLDFWKMGKGRDFWTDLDPPKVLGDCFEAVLGAIFLDSRFNVELCTNFLQKVLIQPWIKDVLSPTTVEKHPVSMLFEWFSQCNDWSFEVTSMKRDPGAYSEPKYEAKIVIHGVTKVICRARGKQTARRLCAKEFIEMVEQDSEQIKGMTFVIDENGVKSKELQLDLNQLEQDIVKKPSHVTSTRAFFAKKYGNLQQVDPMSKPGSWGGGLGQVRGHEWEMEAVGLKPEVKGMSIPVRVRWGCSCGTGVKEEGQI